MQHNNWYNYYNLLIFDQIDSTSDEAKRLCKAGITENFLIWAKSQTKGRGKYGRNWISPEGNLYLSILIKPDFNVKKSLELSFLTAVAVGDTVEKYLSDQKLEYKWPNDIMLNKKKLGGIIIESSTQANSSIIDSLIIGLGINIKSYPTQNVTYTATSLLNENLNVHCEELLNNFMKNFLYNYLLWEDKGFEFIRKKWLKRAMNLNNVITVDIGRNRITGVFTDLNDNGILEIKLASGEICQISSGEIINYN